MGNLVIIMGTVLLGFVLVYLLLKRQISAQMNQDSVLIEIKREVQQVLTELNRVTDRNVGLLEDRINSLTDLLTKADKKIALLQREKEKYNISKNYNNIIRHQQPVLETEPPVEPPPEKPKELSVREQVLQLYKEGISNTAIASRLNVPIGEVELMISLVER